MKRILQVLSVLAILSFSAQSAQLITNGAPPAVINNLIPTNQLLISSITIANTTTTNSTVVFFDSPRAVLLWTNSAFTSRVSTIGNITNIYTNFLGVIETNMFTNYIVGGFVTNAASTNAHRILASISVPATNTVTYTPSSPLVTTYGLTVTNNPNVNITVNYSNVR